MIVNHLSAARLGGGSTAARRLHEALRAAGVESRLWCRRRDADAPPEDACRSVRWQARPHDPAAVARKLAGPARRVWQQWRLRSALAGRPANSSAFSLPRRPLPTPIDPERMGDGVLHLHEIARWVDFPSFFASIPEQLPVVWTLHDMFPFTGGCHYAGGCEAYLTECRHCPQLGRRGEKDLANASFHVKRRALRGKNLHVVTPSQWMTREAKRSRLFANARSIRTIPYGLDTDVFRPRAKAEARRAWDLPVEGTVIAFGADCLETPRKGLRQFLECLQRMDRDPALRVILFGKGRVPGAVSGLPPWVHVGQVEDVARRVLLYSAADILVVPSLEDNLPLSGLEAMACGTPVVGFAAGGLPDFIRPQQTGLLAETGNAADLARQTNWLVRHPQDGRRMGHNGRLMIEREFSQAQELSAYQGLYERLGDELRPPERFTRQAA